LSHPSLDLLAVIDPVVLYNYTTISFIPEGVDAWRFPIPFPTTWSS
jgi:hypothetical protein